MRLATLAFIGLLTACASAPTQAPIQPCPVPVVQDTACSWVIAAAVRPTRAEVGTASAPGTMPASTLAKITGGNNAIKANCPKEYAAWKASLGPWQ